MIKYFPPRDIVIAFSLINLLLQLFTFLIPQLQKHPDEFPFPQTLTNEETQKCIKVTYSLVMTSDSHTSLLSRPPEVASAMELAFGKYCPMPGAHRIVATLRFRLLLMFQIANVMLFIATAVESTLLLQLYISYTLAFVITGLLVCLANFVLSVDQDGILSLSEFLSEVVFLFVLFTCLPVVDEYRKSI